jgi:hypothetical protein
MKYCVALLLVVMTYSAEAADYSLRFGPSIQNSAPDGSSKIFGVRREAPLARGLSYAMEGGGYVDNAGGGRKGSGLAKLQVGTTPGDAIGVFGKAFVGPCYLTTTDNQLGGHGQFCSDVGVGLRDSESFMAVNYSHISSAGLAMPNRGRDFLVFETGLRFK